MMHEEIRRRLRMATGLDLPPQMVDAAVRRRMQLRRTADAGHYLVLALGDASELEALIELVVVPESWFFRDADAFEAALRFVRARLAKGSGPVHLLSIPCAAGEEPYSLAMALTDAGIADKDFRIVAIDISRQAVERARSGLYQRNAFRTRDLAFRDRHFSAQDTAFQLSAGIRNKVEFRCANLFSLDAQAEKKRYDLVFCRNLLIYFDEATQRAAIARLDELLAEGGMLFSGYAETAAFCRNGFAMAPMSKAFALTRSDSPAQDDATSSQRVPLARPRGRARQARALLTPMPTLAPAAVPAAAAPDAAAPDAAETILARARQLADAGHSRDAKAAFRKYLQRVPDSAEAYFMIGLLSEHDQDDRTAEECLKRAVYLDPDHYDALCHLALLAERGGDQSGATRLRERASRVFGRRPLRQGKP